MPSLSPRDAFGLFRIVESQVAAQASPQIQKVCEENIDRVLLIINFPGPNVFTTNPNAPVQQGISVSANVPYLLFTQHDHGNLSQVAWYVNGPMAGQLITVLEQIVDRWPQSQADQNATRQAIPEQAEANDCDN